MRDLENISSQIDIIEQYSDEKGIHERKDLIVVKEDSSKIYCDYAATCNVEMKADMNFEK